MEQDPVCHFSSIYSLYFCPFKIWACLRYLYLSFHLYLSGRTFAPGKLHRSSRIILQQQRLPTPIQLLAVGGGAGVDVVYQGKGTDLCRIYLHGTCRIVFICLWSNTGYRYSLFMWFLSSLPNHSSMLANQCSLSDVFLWRPKTVYRTVQRTRTVTKKVIYCCTGWKKRYSSSRDCREGKLKSIHYFLLLMPFPVHSIKKYQQK